MPKEKKLVIAVAGSAPIKSELVEDLLTDYLRIDRRDEKKFVFILPAEKDLTTEAVVHVYNFAMDIEADYYAIVGEELGHVKAKRIARNAKDVVETDTVPAEIISTLMEAQDSDNEEPLLMLAWGPDDAGPDETTAKLLEWALEEKIRVLDLTAGLEELTYEDEPVSDVAEEHPKERIVQAVEKELVEEEKELAASDEAQADLHKLTVHPDVVTAEDQIPDLLTFLSFVAQMLDAEDRRNAALNMTEMRRRPITIAARHYVKAMMMDREKETAKPSEPVQEPIPDVVEETPKPLRGKPRNVSEDVVKVLINEKAGTIRIREGRGRAKKDEIAKEMTRAEYQELADSGQYEVL